MQIIRIIWRSLYILSLYVSFFKGAAYVGSWIYLSRKMMIWGQPRGENVLDTGAHFYETYETKDGKYMAVGSIEPQFYAILLEKTGKDADELPQLLGKFLLVVLKKNFCTSVKMKYFTSGWPFYLQINAYFYSCPFYYFSGPDSDNLKEKLAQIFKEKTRDEWGQIFDGTDACVTPILELDEAPEHPHNKARKAFVKNFAGDLNAPVS